MLHSACTQESAVPRLGRGCTVAAVGIFGMNMGNMAPTSCGCTTKYIVGLCKCPALCLHCSWNWELHANALHSACTAAGIGSCTAALAWLPWAALVHYCGCSVVQYCGCTMAVCVECGVSTTNNTVLGNGWDCANALYSACTVAGIWSCVGSLGSVVWLHCGFLG